ncbi:MAG TPA: carboxypeptidase-like regulatory domain-containing protein [Candidatus Limnocylindria bacterium]|nr:carboxypeptidase-like regulatory domain-containing protein [Candidatus Limnocylindria bacterium]
MKVTHFPRRFAPLALLLGCFAWLVLARAEDLKPATATVTSPTNETKAAEAPGTDAKKPLLPPVIPLALTNLFTPAENGDWGKDDVMSVVPRGRTNDFAGVRFWVEGLLQLQGKAMADQGRKFRERIVVPLPKPTNFTTLHLLGGMSYDDPLGTKVAEVTWRYTDGSFKRSPLQYGVHMRDWWGRRYEEPATVSDAHSKAVWRGVHTNASKWGKYLRLYLTSLANPDTNKPVKAVEFTSAMARPTMFLVGVTLDPLPAGARDGDFRDLDEGRGGLTGTQYVTALDSVTGAPIAGAKVKVHGKEHVETPDFAEYDREGVTAANGIAAVQQSQDGLDLLEIRVEAENYVTAKKEVNLKKGDKLPPNVEIRLKGGLTIGGVVQDPDGQPLAAAKVSVGRIYRGDEDLAKQTDFEFNHQETTSDAEGKWSAKGIPMPLLPDLYLSARHPDYVGSDGRVVGDNARTVEQLTNRTYVIKLARGFEIAGVVLGPDDKPFPGARVKAGHRWGGDSNREATSGADGRFQLHNVKGELQAVTATADGYAPATKAVTPGTNVTELTLKLSLGASIKGIVLNPEGEPVARARLVYEPQNVDYEASRRNNLEWEGTTDEQGRFEWKSAPEGESEFYVYKEGYAQKRGVKLKAGEEDNIIHLGRARKVLGVVGDSQTRQPIAKFFVWPAKGDENGFNSWSGSDKHEFNDAEGHFMLDLNDESHNVIQVGAEDYLPKFVVLPPPQDDYVTVTVLLDASPTGEGTVVDATGQPVPDVQVGVVGKDWNSGLQIGRGRLTVSGSRNNTTRSDSQGHFKPPGVPDPRLLVAISPAGYGETTWAEFGQTQTIVLQPFGRIEGTLSIAGKAAEGQGLVMNFSMPGAGQMIADWNAFKVDTDKDGKFVFDQVPPGERDIVRLIQTAPNSWMHSHRTTVTVLPGQTTMVNLGNVGALITGRVNSALATAGQTNASVSGLLSTSMPQPPGGFKTPAEYQAWAELPETIAAMRQQQHYDILIQPDGSFSVDGVVPGVYSLAFNASKPKPDGQEWERVTLGSMSQPLNVGEEAANALVPIEVGELTIPPAPPPSSPTGTGN